MPLQIHKDSRMAITTSRYSKAIKQNKTQLCKRAEKSL